MPIDTNKRNFYTDLVLCIDASAEEKWAKKLAMDICMGYCNRFSEYHGDSLELQFKVKIISFSGKGSICESEFLDVKNDFDGLFDAVLSVKMGEEAPSEDNTAEAIASAICSKWSRKRNCIYTDEFYGFRNLVVVISDSKLKHLKELSKINELWNNKYVINSAERRMCVVAPCCDFWDAFDLFEGPAWHVEDNKDYDELDIEPLARFFVNEDL